MSYKGITNRLRYTEYYLRRRIEHEGSADLRKEYSKLRKEGERRIKALGADAYGRESSAYRMNKEGFKSLYDIKSDADLVRETAKLAGFLTSKHSTVRELKKYRKETVKKLQRRGLDEINEANLEDFGNFMEFMRNTLASRVYDSARIAAIFNLKEEKGFSTSEIMANFNWWLDNINKVGDYYVPEDIDTADAYRKAMIAAKRKATLNAKKAKIKQNKKPTRKSKKRGA